MKHRIPFFASLLFPLCAFAQLCADGKCDPNENPEYEKKKLLAVDMSWSPDGKYLLAYVQDGVVKDAGRILPDKIQRGTGELDQNNT